MLVIVHEKKWIVIGNWFIWFIGFFGLLGSLVYCFIFGLFGSFGFCDDNSQQQTEVMQQANYYNIRLTLVEDGPISTLISLTFLNPLNCKPATSK